MHMNAYEFVIVETSLNADHEDDVSDNSETTQEGGTTEDEGAEFTAHENNEDVGHENEGAETEDFVNVGAWEQHANEQLGSDDDSLILLFQFIQRIVCNYKDTDMLINTGPTVSVINNDKMLVNIKDSPHKLRAYTNGRHQDSTKKGELPGFLKSGSIPIQD